MKLFAVKLSVNYGCGLFIVSAKDADYAEQLVKTENQDIFFFDDVKVESVTELNVTDTPSIICECYYEEK